MIKKLIYSSEKLERYNCAGTVQDFMVAMLANLRKPVMSVQNAASWGYYNTEQSEWNSSLLGDAGFPTQLLPDVIPSGDVAGTLADQWHGIPAGTPVGEFNFIQFFKSNKKPIIPWYRVKLYFWVYL